MKPILVTGGAGFVGSHTCKALSRAGYPPVTFDNLERGGAGGTAGLTMKDTGAEERPNDT
jgi:UDP-arabinose 4-epimerase